MKKSKKFTLLKIVLILLVMVSILQVKSFAADVNTVVIKQEENKYIIYIEGMLDQAFEFSYSKTNDNQSLNYINATKDSDGNYVAYVDSELKTNYFDGEEAYIWVKVNNTATISGQKITLSDGVTEEQLSTIEKIAANIQVEAEAEDDKLTIKGNEGETYYYQIDSISSSETYNTLLTLVNEINSSSTDTFTKIKDYVKLYELYNTLISSVDGNEWIETTDLQITKPYGATEDTQYILWLKDSNGNVSVQIITAYEEEVTVVETKETTSEVAAESDETTDETENEDTALPYTYDEITSYVIALGITILAIIAILVIRKKMSDRKE